MDPSFLENLHFIILQFPQKSKPRTFVRGDGLCDGNIQPKVIGLRILQCGPNAIGEGQFGQAKKSDLRGLVDSSQAIVKIVGLIGAAIRESQSFCDMRN